MNGVEKEHLVRMLAAALDHDERTGLAAVELARSVVSLIQDRDSTEMVLLAGELNALAFGKFKRGPR